MRTGADMLNRLIKDIIIDQNALPSLSQFVVVLRERIQTTNQLQRMFLIEWVSTLDSVPGIDLLQFLPNILEGLFKILCDDNFEVRRNCEQVLDSFLAKITQAANSFEYVITFSFFTVMSAVFVRGECPIPHMLAFVADIMWPENANAA